eukprot:CAMPEP_0206046990 /NCGR_PEP_ID=MMETSP1466-20131121/20047_1 /ASSEMBLY_ACC=CAM_ASM_001126 /TAXON_ID=44452 /ORGANISM="Pavlova gyrans, Strain CCMP608" /LENGTH=142 /DNA_ID=CAMNT_0053421993 /DNA_START=194 /DNA_END=620 /DNA_ORIENTATION=-
MPPVPAVCPHVPVWTADVRRAVDTSRAQPKRAQRSGGEEATIHPLAFRNGLVSPTVPVVVMDADNGVDMASTGRRCPPGDLSSRWLADGVARFVGRYVRDGGGQAGRAPARACLLEPCETGTFTPGRCRGAAGVWGAPHAAL